jgi:NAD(P) transhydrogenase subunit alpha
VTADAVKDADVVLKVRRPAPSELARYKKGALVIAMMDLMGEDAALKAMAMPASSPSPWSCCRAFTRAQVHGRAVEPGQPRGYRAVIDGAAEYGRALPMMMTGAARFRRRGSSSWGGRRRPAGDRHRRAGWAPSSPRPTSSGVEGAGESLGAKFVAVEDDEFKQAETAGGYAKEMSKEYQAKQAALVAEHIKKQDIVITTALIPGRPAPRPDLEGDGRIDAARAR